MQNALAAGASRFRMHLGVLIVTTVALVSAPGLARAIELRVMVPNLRGAEPVVVMLYDDPARWAAGAPPLAQAKAPVENGMAVARFDPPPGRYAVVAFQDKDSDGRLKLWPFGWAVEPVGYSGGARPWFGRPSWDKADFGLDEEDRTTVFVRLK